MGLILHPVEHPRHLVADGELVVVRGDDLRHAATFKPLTGLKWLDVGFPLIHPTAQIGIDRKPDHTEKDIALLGLRHRRFAMFEIGGDGRAMRARGEQDFMVGGHWSILPG